MEDILATGIDKSLSDVLGNKVQLEIKELHISQDSRLVGMDVGKYLIIKIDQIDSTTKRQLKDKYYDIFVTYPQEGTYLGFHSKITSISSAPEDLAFIKYPKTIGIYDRRSHKRIDCFLPAKFAINNESTEGPIIDISCTGCCCKINDQGIFRKTKLGKFTMFLRCSEKEDSFSVLGDVTNVRRQHGENSIGIAFNKIDNNTQDVMHNLIPDLSFNN